MNVQPAMQRKGRNADSLGVMCKQSSQGGTIDRCRRRARGTWMVELVEPESVVVDESGLAGGLPRFAVQAKW